MADYKRLRNRRLKEYVDSYTHANRDAWAIQLDRAKLEEAPKAPPASAELLTTNGQLGSATISLLIDVLNTIKLRVSPVYLFTKPSTLDFGKAKESLGQYVSNLQFTVIPLLQKSAGGTNNMLLQQTLSDTRRVVELLTQIVNEFGKMRKYDPRKDIKRREKIDFRTAEGKARMEEQRAIFDFYENERSQFEAYRTQVMNLINSAKNIETQVFQATEAEQQAQPQPSAPSAPSAPTSGIFAEEPVMGDKSIDDIMSSVEEQKQAIERELIDLQRQVQKTDYGQATESAKKRKKPAEEKGGGMRVAYSEDSPSKLYTQAGRKYALLERPTYNPLQGMLDQLKMRDKSYLDSMTNDNLKFRLHKNPEKMKDKMF